MKWNAFSRVRVGTFAAAGCCIPLFVLSGTAPIADQITVKTVPAERTVFDVPASQTVFQVPYQQTVFHVPYEQTVFEVPESQTVFTVEPDSLCMHDSPYITVAGPRLRASAAFHLADGLWLLLNEADALLAVMHVPGRLQVTGSDGEMVIMYAGFTDEEIIDWLTRGTMAPIADNEHFCRCTGRGFVSFAYCSDDAFCSCDEFDDHIRAQCLTISEQ